MSIRFTEEALATAAEHFKDALRSMTEKGYSVQAFDVGKNPRTGDAIAVLVFLDRREVIDGFLDQAEAAGQKVGKA
jgi:hypothetical protein